ncbi:MAG: winged helix-turn-helix transcriptional regulator, partial [Candidatus Thermoplasmatota archaeon]|nr:winged helix-turn-helix transcriptional regulator [Candidatus Thermoplasmatota archaeon]
QDLVNVDELVTYQGFEMLLLPEVLRVQMGAPLDTSLPGPSTALEPNLDLLTYRATSLALPTISSDFGMLAPVSSPSATDEGPGVMGTDAPTDVRAATDGRQAATQTDAQVRASDEHGDPAHEQDPTLNAQSAKAASTQGGLAQAWEELSKEEKVAVAAGSILLSLLGAMTMYSRITRDETLENDTRRGIYELVEANPGLCIKDVADRVDVSYSTASYHLDRLVKTDYLVASEEGNKVLYYKNGGSFSPAERDLVPILKNPECMAVFEVILENPWCYRAEVAKALGVSHTTVNWHLKRLTKANLVEEHREGRNCHLYVNDQSLDRVCQVMDKMESLGATDDIAFQHTDPVPA